MRRLLAVAVALLALGQCACTSHQPWKPRFIILLSLDTCRADHLSCYGYARPTSPNIDRVAQEGVRFANAFSQSNESLFSYAAVLTGLYPERIAPLNYDDFFLPRKQITLASMLGSAGYRTGAFVAGGNLKAPYGFNQGFETYRDTWDYGSLFHTMPVAFKWLEGLPRNAPTFLFLQGYDAHAPYDKPMFFNELFDPQYRGIGDYIARTPASSNVYNGHYFKQFRWKRLNARHVVVVDTNVFYALPKALGKVPSVKLSEADIRHVIAHYDGGIAYADVFVGLLMARLHELGLEKETLLIVMGDHGEDLMEHGFFNHRCAVYDASLHVPLIFWGPGGLPQGKVVNDVVELLDIMPTILDYANIGRTVPMDGASLRPLLEGTDTSRFRLAFSEGILHMTTVRSATDRLICMHSSRRPFPTLNATDYRYVRVRDGRESATPIDDAGATRRLEDMVRWRAHCTTPP